MSAPGDALDAGAVLRGIGLDPRPRVLPVPAGTQARLDPPRATAPAVDVRPAGSGSIEASPGYTSGYRAGFAEGEAAQRARDLEAIDASRAIAVEQGREEGRRQGIAEGREFGKAAVDREARTALDAAASRLAQLDRLLASLPAELTRRLSEAEDDMVALCHGVVCRILGEELRTAEGVARLVREALRGGAPAAFGSGHGSVTIHVHPGDRTALEADATIAAWLRGHASAGGVQWVSDERVRLGGCIVRSAEGSLDARLETQLEALRALLSTRHAEGSAAQPAPDAAPDLSSEGAA